MKTPIGKRSKKYKDIFLQVQHVLLWDWDPIGLDVEDKKKYAKDEYDFYANGVIKLLLDNKSEGEIVKYLLIAEKERMGLKPQIGLSLAVASKLKKIDVSKITTP